MQVKLWSTTCYFWKDLVGPVDSISSTISIPFALRQGKAKQTKSCFKGIPWILLRRESPRQAAGMEESLLLTTACSGAWQLSKLRERPGAGKHYVPDQGRVWLQQLQRHLISRKPTPLQQWFHIKATAPDPPLNACKTASCINWRASEDYCGLWQQTEGIWLLKQHSLLEWPAWWQAGASWMHGAELAQKSWGAKWKVGAYLLTLDHPPLVHPHQVFK